MLRGLQALRSRNYVLYLVGHFTSQTGAWVEQTAVSWILYELTGSAVLLGLAGLARAVPTIALALVGGAVADRLPRRAMLYCTESFMFDTRKVIAEIFSITGAIGQQCTSNLLFRGGLNLLLRGPRMQA